MRNFSIVISLSLTSTVQCLPHINLYPTHKSLCSHNPPFLCTTDDSWGTVTMWITSANGSTKHGAWTVTNGRPTWELNEGTNDYSGMISTSKYIKNTLREISPLSDISGRSSQTPLSPQTTLKILWCTCIQNKKNKLIMWTKYTEWHDNHQMWEADSFCNLSQDQFWIYHHFYETLSTDGCLIAIKYRHKQTTWHVVTS